MNAMLATLKLTIRRFPDSSHIVDAELSSDASAAPSQLASNVPVAFDKAALFAVESDPATYGRALSAQLFADPRLRNGWLKARAFAATGDLQLRLNLDAGDTALHDLHWERLRDPETDQPVALYERVCLARTLESADLTPVVIPPRPELRALVIVSNPSHLADYNLAEVDVEGEIGRARAALGDIPATILADHADASGRATLENLTAVLRDAPPIVILVAHGTIPDDTPYVWLEQDDGTPDRVTGDTIAETLRRLSVRPLLLVLASCRSAGGGYSDTLRALGPQLAHVGVPAVLAFQGDVAMSTVKTLLPTLITELRRNGQIDRALAAARGALGERRPWWQAVLWLRTDGWLWRERTPSVSNALISIDGSQTTDITVGDVAHGNITKTTINVWVWDHFGQDIPEWLTRQLEQREQKKNPEERIKEEEREQLKKANLERWAQVDWAQVAQVYRHDMLRLYGSMQIFGMNQPVPLADVFTDVYLLDKPSAWRRHNIEALRQNAKSYPIDSTLDQRIAGGDLVARKQRLFILGQPGAGKTTFLKHLVMEAIQGIINGIPIFVSLKTWADSGLDLMPFLIRQFAICNFPNAQPFIETILNEGKAMVLFDGLDEVNDTLTQRQRTTQAIREFAEQYGKSQVVITCRTAATEYTFEQFTYCELADFTQEQIEAFIGRWFQRDEAKRVAFLEAFARPENERLSELARRPLLLTMLCLTFEETMAFPNRRAELYEEAIDALLKKWDSSRSIQRDQVYRKLSLGYKRQLLTELAAETFERGEFFIPKTQLTEHIVRFLRRLPPTDQSEDIDGEAVLRAIEAHHGLLIERARNIYSFSHLTFHEYFAARYIADHPYKEVLNETAKRAANPQWREVLLLTTSMLDYRNASVLFRLWSQHLKEYIQTDSLLREFIEWVYQHSPAEISSSPRARAAGIVISSIDHAITINKLFISLLVELRKKDPDYAKDLDSVLNQSYGIHTILMDARRLDQDLISLLSQAHGSVKNRSEDQITNRALPQTLDRNTARTIDKNLNITLIRAISCAELYMHFVGGNARNDGFAFKDLAHNIWSLTQEHFKPLEVYLLNTLLFLECLELATLEDRETFMSQLLPLASPSSS